MATVPFQDRLALTHPLTGITVGVYPSSDPFYDIQIYRAASTKSGAGPTSVPASSKFSELATLGVINGQASVTYRDSLPLSNTLWWYKARSVKTNVATPSAFTTAVYSQAGLMPTSTPGAIPFTGRPINVSPRLSTIATPVYGTSSGSAFYKKTVRLDAVDFSPVTSTVAYNKTNNNLICRSTVTTQFTGVPKIPRGATITAVRWRFAKGATSTKSVQAAILINTSQNGGTIATLANLNGSTHVVGFFTLSASFSGVVLTTGNFVKSYVTLKSTVTGTVLSQFVWMDVDYQIPNLGVGL